MPDLPRCTSWLGSVLGHKFVARYDEGAPTARGDQLMWFYDRERSRMLDRSRHRTYRGDVCTRCGLVVNKEKDG